MQKRQDAKGGYDCTTLDEVTYIVRPEPTLEVLDQDPEIDPKDNSSYKIELVEAEFLSTKDAVTFLSLRKPKE